MSIKIITDSTSYIPKEYIETLGIEVLSLNIIMQEKSTREVDWDNESFYKAMAEAKEFPKSSQPSIEEAYEVFEKIVAQGDEIVGIFLSSKMSGTVSTMNMIKNQILEVYPEAKMEIIDSTSNCMQMGFAVIEAAKLGNTGAEIDQVATRARGIINQSRFLFTPDTFDYLKMGGRIGNASAILGTVLNIRPILTVENGITCVYKKTRSRKKAIEAILEKVNEDIEGKTLGGICVHHIDCEKEGLILAEYVRENLNLEPIIKSIGPVIGAHVGPGSIGLAYWWS